MPIIKMPGIHISNCLRFIDWKFYRENKIYKIRDHIIWVDRDGMVYTISKPLVINQSLTILPLRDSHLQNLERWILGRGSEDIKARKKAYDRGMYDIIRDEIERRDLSLLDDHESIIPLSTKFDMSTIEEPMARIKG